VSIVDLVRLDQLGPALAHATGDGRWCSSNATLIAGGKSNLTFEVTSEAGVVILRRPPSGELLPSAHDMGREARIQQALAGTSVPVPRVVLREATGELLGVPFYVMEKVAGHVIRDQMPEGYAETPGEKLALANALIDALAELHEVEPKAIGLGDYGRPHGYLERQIRRWNGQWEKTKTHEVAAVDELGGRLARLLPEGQRESIVHGDFRLDNCLMALADPSRVAAVLDWELSTLGDPLTDLGLLLFYWREPGEDERVLTPTVTRNPGFPTRVHLAERYAQLTGSQLDHIAFYEAFAHFKFAVIAQGIASRVAVGAMAGQDFGNLDKEVLKIAEEGLIRLERKDQ
jgi:aminoglycoside phosphotransferase (APT) family kinase protein